jgi:soluble lytic murein transglycosylase-like protein
MLRVALGAVILCAPFCSQGLAGSASHPDVYDDLISDCARDHGVPESLVHRVVMRESRYNPGALHKRYFGLMQITYATARSMGYKGVPKGLLDPKVNLTYGVPYLANAYRVAEGSEDRAVSLYSSGYYYIAKKKKLLAALRTADSPPLDPQPEQLQQQAAAPAVGGLLSLLTARQAAPVVAAVDAAASEAAATQVVEAKPQAPF